MEQRSRIQDLESLRGISALRVLDDILMSFFFGLFYLSVYSKLNFNIWRPLLFLGSISYALYLLHQNVDYIILIFLNEAFGRY